MNYYAFDIETTGLDPKNNRIIELALITPDDSYSWLINPRVPISEKITEITGITQGMVDSGVPFLEAYLDFVTVAQKADRLVGHNAIQFDGAFLKHEAIRCEFPGIPNPEHKKMPVIDTAALFKGLLLGKWPPTAPHSEWAREVLGTRDYGLRYNLAHCAKEMGIEAPEGLHRAEADARLTLDLFLKMLEKYPEIEATL